jgi:hypothetical protein
MHSPLNKAMGCVFLGTNKNSKGYTHGAAFAVSYAK